MLPGLFITNAKSRACGFAGFASKALQEDLKAAFGYCVNLVKTHDYENYIWCMQLEKVDRPAMLALRAYNVETSLIAEKVTKGGAMLREMRYKWWDDALNELYKGNPPDHPVIKALHSVIDSRHLTRYRLKKIASVRAKDATRQACQAAQAGGKAVGLTGLLRGTIHHAQQGSSYLPKDICDAHGVYMSMIMRGEASEGVRNVIKEVAGKAKEYVLEARGLMSKVPSQARPLLLPVTIADMYLVALEKRGFNVFDPDWNRKGVWPIWLPMKLKYNMMMGHY